MRNVITYQQYMTLAAMLGNPKLWQLTRIDSSETIRKWYFCHGATLPNKFCVCRVNGLRNGKKSNPNQYNVTALRIKSKSKCEEDVNEESNASDKAIWYIFIWKPKKAL